MKRLYENELIYGRLLSVDQPHLVERYNKALQAFGIKPTELTEFDIDKTGFSPQIAKELGDYDYLDPNGVNRRFIILTPSQVSLPVVHTRFSNTDALMYEFYTDNMRVINALTIKDVIYGEIEDNVSVVNDMEDLLSIQQVEFRVLSADDVIGKANELRGLIDRLKHTSDAWRDDAMLNRMVELSKKVGDIRENHMVPEHVVFRHNAYWTSHFDGAYIFVDEKMTTVISDPDAPGFRRSRPWQVSYLPIGDYDRVFRFLAASKRIELPRASWIEETGFLEHRAEMIIRSIIHEAEPDVDMTKVDAVWLQTWLHRNANLVTKDGRYPFLNQIKREIAQNGRVDINEIPEEYRFMLVRAKPDHPDAWLTNRLICEFNRVDFVSRYIFNKQAFYNDYEEYDVQYRNHIVETLKATYLNDKAALRARLYGLD
ncbi:DUF6638 family protein [Ahrensia sp. 13_GOM-1096m]|uniref:DUF6638 family protein n=1 Tax=Ahrensia sp. 13_GOM-1096m TaxID=1380380 RepID=UPI00047D1CF8|nr:DUF6638 family protein [Ahrensia sp. 13_GOM-1096m]